MPSQRPKIIVLDGYPLNPGDLSWTKLKTMGNVEIYDFTSNEEIFSRAHSAEILVVNKTPLPKMVLEGLTALKCICVTATGFNNIDTFTAKEKGIVVSNVSGYASDSVAQHVFALILAFTNKVVLHDRGVRQGAWSRQPHFSLTLAPIPLLSGKVLGIAGLGSIGMKVVEIAAAFGMEVIALRRKGRGKKPGASLGIKRVSKREFFSESDFITLHAPLTKDTEGMINRRTLGLMKSTAYLINTGRGGLVVEKDLISALDTGQIAGAALDVLSQEPPADDHPLLSAPNCLITPHNAWASVDARQKLLDATVENIRFFLSGKPKNVVNQ